ncbi:MAG: hypothetical protein ABL958_02275 [Bdellovibrionia bacterium]
MKLTSILVQVGVLLTFTQAGATILPPNNLHLQDDINRAANMTEQEFNDIIDGVIKKFEPIVAKHGAKLTVTKNWKDSTVNAYAQQTGTNWNVAMFGGLARRAEVTPDGFALVVCHELGHHLGGYAFKGERWAASEGQSDYFATQACAREIWGKDNNSTAAEKVDEVARIGCNKAWKSVADQNLCYRTANASYSLAHLLSVLGGAGLPKFDKPDGKVVTVTNTEHPQGQCRLDTYYQGALCNMAFDLSIIPGKAHADGQNSMAAEKIANKYACNQAAASVYGNRPFCWFKPKITAGQQ